MNRRVYTGGDRILLPLSRLNNFCNSIVVYNIGDIAIEAILFYIAAQGSRAIPDRRAIFGSFVPDPCVMPATRGVHGVSLEADQGG